MYGDVQVTGIVGNPVILGLHGFYADSYRFCDLEGSGVLGPFLLPAPLPSRAGGGTGCPLLEEGPRREEFAEPSAGTQPSWAQGSVQQFCLALSVSSFLFFLDLTSLRACSVAQSCPALCNPIDYSPPGSSVHGIFQASILEWVAISFSKGPSQSRD